MDDGDWNRTIKNRNLEADEPIRSANSMTLARCLAPLPTAENLALFIYNHDMSMNSGVGTDISRPGKAVFAIGRTKLKGIK